MSKDFEAEYRELAQSEIPDLWDRIEAGLTEKSAPVEQIIYVEQAAPVKGTSPFGKISIFAKRYAGLAAAILCVAVMIPAMITLGRLGAGTKDSGSEMADMASYDAAAEEPAEAALMDMAEEEAGTVFAESAAGETETASADMELAEEFTEEKAERASDADSGTENAKMMDEAEMKSASTKQSAMQEDLAWDIQDAEDGGVLEKVTLCTDAEESTVYGSDGKTILGMVYSVTVVQNHPAGGLTEGTELKVFLPKELSDGLGVGTEIQADLAYEPGAQYDYVVKRLYS